MTHFSHEGQDAYPLLDDWIANKALLLLARDAMAILEGYHARLLSASRGFPLFDPHPNPMPITFGTLQAGSDIAALQTTATPMGDDYLLNGIKSWVVNGSIAGVFVLSLAEAVQTDFAMRELSYLNR